MVFKNVLSLVVFILVVAASISTVSAQETIQDQYDAFYDKQTSTWEEYRMIKKPKLTVFWKVVSDTLEVRRSLIIKGRNEISALNVELDSAYAKLSATELALAESNEFNDSILLLGITVSKTFYNLIVWLLILVLVVAVVTMYVMYMRSNSITKKTQKAYGNLEAEHSEHKERARESQVKLKRELQTALNTLQENRINL